MSKNPSLWVDKISRVEMPVLSVIIRQVTRLTGDDDTELNQLAEVVLKDPHLTSQVLRIANGIKVNPYGTSINTISRAIVLLGFDGVKALCVSLMLIDSLLANEPRERLLVTMSKAFHAAVQAKAIFQQVDDGDGEEVFIAALLRNIGEMAFWAYGGQTADQLEASLKECIDENGDKVLIQKVLGISFKKLSRELGKIWNLGDVLQESLSASSRTISPQAQAVRFGESVSQLAATDEGERQVLVKQIAAFTGNSLSATRRLLERSSESAAAVALEYGAVQICHLMPQEKNDSPESQQTNEIQVLAIDPCLQLKILRDLNSSLNEKVDANTIFQMALEGMHRGIGLERVVLAFVQKNRIKAKYVLGQFTQGWRDNFAFDVSANSSNNIFADCLQHGQISWLDNDYLQSHQQCYNCDIIALLGDRLPAFVGALRINNRNVALFYADRGRTNESLTQEQFDAFKHFLSQTELTVQAIADKQ